VMQAYYSLYIDATDELRHMESYITAEHKRGRRMLEVRLRFPLRLASASALWAGLRAPSLLVSAASLTFARRFLFFGGGHDRSYTSWCSMRAMCFRVSTCCSPWAQYTSSPRKVTGTGSSFGLLHLLSPCLHFCTTLHCAALHNESTCMTGVHLPFAHRSGGKRHPDRSRGNVPRRAAPDAWPVPPKLSRAGSPFPFSHGS